MNRFALRDLFFMNLKKYVKREMFHLNGNEQLFNFSALTIFLSFGSHFVNPSNSPLDKSTQQKGIRRPVRILSTF